VREHEHIEKIITDVRNRAHLRWIVILPG
jgi:hypothetical protein